MKFCFSGCRALVLGGSSDLGIELASQMMQEELFPFLTYRNEAGCLKIEERLKKYTGNYQTVFFDLGMPDSTDTLFDTLNHNIDYLVDFAHGDLEGLVGTVDSSDVFKYFEENISARAEMIKKAGRAMLRKKRGKLIFISSAAAKNPNPGQGFYAASKLASEALYRNLGLELKDKGITAISLRPGYIDSGRGACYLNGRQLHSLEKENPHDVLGIREVAETILFFLSDSAVSFNAANISMGESLK